VSKESFDQVKSFLFLQEKLGLPHEKALNFHASQVLHQE